MKTKLYLETLILLWIKWTGMVEMKHTDFIDVVPNSQDLHAKTTHIMVSLLIWSAKGRWKYTKSCFKENARTCSENSTTQGNIKISGLKKRL